MPPYLEVFGPDGPLQVPLSGDRITVGRADANDVVIDDPTASRRHVAIERLAAGWCIHDLNSTNGTFVNGEMLERERPLYPDDEIMVGETRIVYRRG